MFENVKNLGMVKLNLHRRVMKMLSGPQRIGQQFIGKHATCEKCGTCTYNSWWGGGGAVTLCLLRGDEITTFPGQHKHNE